MFPKNTNIKFHKNPSGDNRAVARDGRTDMMQLMVAFRNFVKAYKMCQQKKWQCTVHTSCVCFNLAVLFLTINIAVCFNAPFVVRLFTFVRNWELRHESVQAACAVNIHWNVATM